MSETKVLRKTCTDHCAGCGQHFHGLGAFDAHRVDLACVVPADTSMNKKGSPKLQVWTETGSCERVKGCWVDGKRVRWEEPVTIYQIYGSSYTGPKEES